MPKLHVHHGAARTARAVGVTPKTLRVWERVGLLSAGRNAAGWRLYGPQELVRIHQVLALKALGFPLSEIAKVLNGHLAGLDAVLALQAQALERRRVQAEQGLTMIAAVRGRMAAGEALSPDDFIELIRETTMSTKLSVRELNDLLRPLIDKHLSPDELSNLRRGRAGRLSPDPEETWRAWNALFAEAEALMAADDPTSPAAVDLARRWIALADQFKIPDASLNAKVKAVWSDAMTDPAKGPHLSVRPEILAFVRAAAEASRF